VRHELAEVLDGSSDASESGPYWSFVARLERVVITEALQRSGGNQIQAARLLGINRNTLRRKIVELEIPTDEARSSSD
jgi:two-component system nitrogen regulation response regulator GlnG